MAWCSRINYERVNYYSMFVHPLRRDHGDTLSGDIEVEYCGRRLDIVKSYKHLGITLKSDLNWSAHIAYVAQRISWKMDALQQAG